MRRSILLFTSLFTASFANAADLPKRADPQPPSLLAGAPVISWGGVYAGVHTGSAWGTAAMTPLPAGARSNLRYADVTGGALAGYNHAFGNVIAGAELEFGLGRASGASTFAGPPATVEQQTGGGWHSRARLRAGYRFGNALIYGVAGLTARRETLTLATIFPSPAESRSLAANRTGWNLGLGVDYAIAPNWISRAEYIYDHFGARTANFAAIPGSTIASRKVDTSAHTLRLAIIYKFGDPLRRDTPAPISVLY